MIAHTSSVEMKKLTPGERDAEWNGGSRSSTTFCSGQTHVNQENPVSISPNRGKQAPYYLCAHQHNLFHYVDFVTSIMKIKNKINYPLGKRGQASYRTAYFMEAPRLQSVSQVFFFFWIKIFF